jgi:hypothetical protein
VEPQPLLYQSVAAGDGAEAPWSLTWLEQKVWAADGITRDYLGTSFAMSGDVALAGAPYQRGSAGNYQGAVYVFARSGGIWAQAQKLTASDGVANAVFGNTLALDGDSALIGATGTGSAVYLFTRAGDGSWSQTQKLVPADGVTPSGFGSQLALEGDLALVGASSAAANGSDGQGKVYVFRRAEDGSWSEAQQLVASDGVQNLHFGSALAFRHGEALVGASGATVAGFAGAGAIYAFSETETGFVQTQRFSSSDSEAYRTFGNAIALSGDRALIAANGRTVNGNSFAGAVYYFTKTDSGWTETQRLIANDSAASMLFGQSVTFLGPTAVIGASSAAINGNINQGAAYVFTDVSGTWTQTGKLVASDGAPANYYGWRVAFDGHTLGSSANAAGIGGVAYLGAVYFNERSGGDPHTVTPVLAAGLGTIAPDTPQTIDDTATATFTLTPDAGYRIDGVGGNCDGTLQGEVYTTAPITADCTVEVRFAVLAQTVTPSVAGGHGTISPDTPQTVDYGGALTFTLAADADYVPDLVDGSCGGTLVGATFTTDPVTSDCSVVAHFRPAQHTVTPNVAGGHGTISPDTPQTVQDGATLAFTLTPEPGYGANVGGTCGGTLAGDTYTTAPVIADCTVDVSYAPIVYTVTPRLLTAHGIIAPGLPQSAGYGDVLTFTLQPDPGYVATVGGSCGGTLEGDTYTTAPVTASCTVDASFAPAPTHTVTPSVAGGHGTISPDTPQTAVEGSAVVFALVPDSGYVIAAVGGSCGGTLDGSTYTTAPVAGDCTVEASFTPDLDPIFADGFD